MALNVVATVTHCKFVKGLGPQVGTVLSSLVTAGGIYGASNTARAGLAELTKPGGDPIRGLLLLAQSAAELYTISRNMSQSCFTGETLLDAEHGRVRADALRVGDRLWSRSEHDPEGSLALKEVEEVFVRVALVFHLHVGGGVIRTTGEHPFYVVGRGWTKVVDLFPGDLLLRRDESVEPVEEVTDSGTTETVYNWRIAEFHTYFVCWGKWICSIWAPNADCLPTPRRAQHGAIDHHHEMNAQPVRHLAGRPHPQMPAGVVPAARQGGRIPREVRTNQGTINPANPDGPALQTAAGEILRPDVQVLGTDGRVYVTEVIRLLPNGQVNIAYHQNRSAELHAVYGQSWGGYHHIDIP